MIPPKPQLRKYLSELGSIFPRGSLRSCVAILYVSVNIWKRGECVRSIKSKAKARLGKIVPWKSPETDVVSGRTGLISPHFPDLLNGTT